jgi:hypothetical protein
MEIDIKGSISTGSHMGMVSIIGLMEQCFRVILKMV